MKNYKYLDLPDSAPQWLKDAHASGHTGVWCGVWDSDGGTEHVKRCFIAHYNGKEYITSTGEFWDHAKPIEIEPECETVKVRIQPFLGASHGEQFMVIGDEIKTFKECLSNRGLFNGPEQEIEIKVYKTKEV